MLKLAVVLASAGRPALLAEAVQTCLNQSNATYRGILSVPDRASLPPLQDLPPDWEIVMGTRGLAAQRNAALAKLTDVDLVAFFDDDSILRSDYLQNAVRFFEENPSVAGITGEVLLDGATSGEIGHQAASDAIENSLSKSAWTGTWSPTRELYGCNFVIRLSLTHGIQFDERLPLYSWLEDHDFARRLMRHGALAKVRDCVIVHRAAASGGRTSHIRLGYSQLMNPIHLYRTGSFPLWLTFHETYRRVAKNTALSLLPNNQRDWRRMRLKGNLIAAGDVLRGRVTPERITNL